jgi:hypothetical protein
MAIKLQIVHSWGDKNRYRERDIIFFDYEFQALLEALRRDLRVEADKSLCEDAAEQRLHTHNVRRNKRLLEVLQPKKPHPVVKQEAPPNNPPNIALEVGVNMAMPERFLVIGGGRKL